MSRTARIGVALIVFGLIGALFVVDAYSPDSIIGIFVTIVSVILLIGGVLLLWKEWGGKKK